MMRYLILLFGLLPYIVSAEISAHEYHQRLGAIATALETNQLVAAQALSRELTIDRIAWPSGTLAVDPRIDAALQAGHAGTASRRIAQLREQVARHLAIAPNRTADFQIEHQALEAIAKQQQAAQLARGGTLDELHLHQPEQLKPLAERLLDAMKWLFDLLRDGWDWLRWLFGFSGAKNVPSDNGSVTSTAVLIGIGLLVATAIILAVRRTPPSVSNRIPVSAATNNATDQDPRSRAADEWIQYARRLASEGRQREAVRAWYHALLVTCWARGHLHHRTGKTNWEYAVILSTTLSWSNDFGTLTARFDRAWYGGQDDAAYAADAELLVYSINAEATP